jgi:hypothetical protein
MEPVLVTPIVVQQNCTPIFDEYNDITARAPGFQGLWEFSGPDPDQLIDGAAIFRFTTPGEDTLEFRLPIFADSSSGVPIADLNYPDEDLLAGTYTWLLGGVFSPEGDPMEFPEVGGTFEFDQVRADGCADFP